jgi:hypothetical protein
MLQSKHGIRRYVARNGSEPRSGDLLPYWRKRRRCIRGEADCARSLIKPTLISAERDRRFGPWENAENDDMKEPRAPAWLKNARKYYSKIRAERTDPVNVFIPPNSDEVSGESPGTLCLRLEPQSRFSPMIRVLDAGGHDVGIIRSTRFVPGIQYTMINNNVNVWTLSVRSVVRKRHVLELANGDLWTFDTPFFWWQHLTGTAFGTERLLGCVGPTMRYWLMQIESGWDTFDLLAAVAFMHRQWWRS